ncbi:MAG TPA: hypothetical protein VMQ50_14185 [Casimicrobiaceae bacterium]|nr:hypothetical protein [Casimicrobiaceae bacterium]
MTPVVGLIAIAAIILLWFIGRSVANARRRRKLHQRHKRPRAAARPRRLESKRSEMRAYEDPTTVVGDITTTRGQVEKEGQ